MISGNSTYGSFLLRTDRMPGEVPLPYVKTGRLTFIAGLVLAFHAALIVIPMIFLAISEMIKKPPVFVMRLPTVDRVPSEQPSPHPSPLNKKAKGTPDKGKPLSEIPKIPDLVKPIEPPQPPRPQPDPVKPKPQVKPKKTPEVKKLVDKPVPESKKTIPVQPKPKKTVLSASDIKISHKRVKNPSQDAARQKRLAEERARQAAEQARQARNAEMAKTLRSLSGTQGGTGTPGGGGGPRGIVSKEVNEYYSKVEEFLKRRWDQPSVFGGGRPKVLILFRVAADGRVISARIQERSGNAAMDSSVEKLLRDLKTLPAPPQAMEFTVTMEIDR